MHKYTRKNLPHYQARKLKFLSVIAQNWGAIRFSCIFGGFHKFFSGFLCKIPKYYCSKLSAIRFSCKFGGFHNFFSGITAQNWGAIRFSCIFGGFQKKISGFCVHKIPKYHCSKLRCHNIFLCIWEASIIFFSGSLCKIPKYYCSKLSCPLDFLVNLEASIIFFLVFVAIFSIIYKFFDTTIRLVGQV